MLKNILEGVKFQYKVQLLDILSLSKKLKNLLL